MFSSVYFNFYRFCAIVIYSEVHSTDFEQYEINSKTGLYFEELADLQVFHTEWQFVTYVNLSQFNTEVEHLENTVLKIEMFCDQIKAEFSLANLNANCDHLMPQLHTSLADIREYSTKWFTNRDINAETRYENDFRGFRRKKRGFMGTITKSLFGTLSEDEGKFYLEQINTLKTKNIEQLDLNKKHTTIFQETLKVLNNTMQSENIQSIALQTYFDDLSFVLKNATNEAVSVQVSSVLFNKLSEIIHYTSLLIIGCREKQRYFFEAITTKSKSFQLIPPRIFFNELERISLSVVSQGLVLPISLTRGNLLKFYQITTTEGRIIDNNLIVRFSIPLVESKKFILYKATSAPRRNVSDEAFNFIVPRNEYIAYDGFDEKFATLTLDEIKNCHRIHSKHFVCKQTFPIMSAHNNGGCEINLLRNRNISSNCDLRTANLTEEIWVQLQQPNTYLYTLPKSVSITILCSHSRTSLQLHGTGVIAIAQRCRIKTDHVEIVAFQTMESKIFRGLSVSNKFNLNISSEIIKAKEIKNVEIPDFQLSTDMNDENFKKIAQMNVHLNDLQIRNEIDKASAMNVLNAVINNSGGIGQYILAVIMIFIAVAIVYACIKYGIIAGGNILIYVILVVLAIATVLYII